MESKETPIWKHLRFWAVVQAVVMVAIIVVYGSLSGINDLPTLGLLLLGAGVLVAIVTGGLYLRWQTNKDTFHDQGWEW